MKHKRLVELLDGLMEKLAAIEHERWSHWQRYMHDKGQVQADGSLIIPKELVQRWERLIALPYDAMTEAEKESDRDQVRRYLPILVAHLADDDSEKT